MWFNNDLFRLSYLSNVIKYKRVRNFSSSILVLSSLSLAVFVAYINLPSFSTYWYILPLIPFLVGIVGIFTFFNKYVNPSAKIIAVYSSNALMFYLIALLIEMGRFGAVV
jgi:hypothetical protein